MTLLRDKRPGAQLSAARAVGTEPILIAKFVEALGLFSRSEVSAGDRFGLQTDEDSRSSVHKLNEPQRALQIMGSLYESILYRSFQR